MKLNDKPEGFAEIMYFDEGKPARVVRTRGELLDALKTGGNIAIEGMIDITDTGNGTMIPSKCGQTTPALDIFVRENSQYGSYDEYKNAYIRACRKVTDDKEDDQSKTVWKLKKAYEQLIHLKVRSNTVLFGVDNKSGIKGGMLMLKRANNIAIRNLILQDAYDPFPHHEAEDDFNAQFDMINTFEWLRNIWVDHCAFRTTLESIDVVIGDGTKSRWLCYDGYFDIKGDATNITVSNCLFEKGHKVSLIGSSDKEPVVVERKITYCHNYFKECDSRMPMARNATVHVYGNVYETTNMRNFNSYIGVRSRAKLLVEGNRFGKGYAYRDNIANKTSMLAYPLLFEDNNTYFTQAASINSNNKNKLQYTSVLDEPPFVVPYSYEIGNIDEVPHTAGTALWDEKLNLE